MESSGEANYEAVSSGSFAGLIILMRHAALRPSGSTGVPLVVERMGPDGLGKCRTLSVAGLEIALAAG